MCSIKLIEGGRMHGTRIRAAVHVLMCLSLARQHQPLAGSMMLLAASAVMQTLCVWLRGCIDLAEIMCSICGPTMRLNGGANSSELRGLHCSCCTVPLPTSSCL
jgi:hypothetical protein